LTISTSKQAKAIITTASVGTREGAFVSHVMCQDYWKQLAFESCTRATAKRLQAQHDEVLTKLDNIVSDVTSFYAGSN
jgi:hypothetical protein